MTRPGSIPDHGDSIPPPSGTSVEDRLAWCVDVLQKGPLRHLPSRVTALEESLGIEGNAAKGREATGLHLALERAQKATEDRFTVLEGEISAVLKAVNDVASGLAADRAKSEAAAAALAKEREPKEKDRATVRAAFLGGFVSLVLAAGAAFLARHWRW